MTSRDTKSWYYVSAMNVYTVYHKKIIFFLKKEKKYVVLMSPIQCVILQLLNIQKKTLKMRSTICVNIIT